MALSADAVAHAVIASAKIFGCDPIIALESKTPINRRPLTPAALGIARATGIPERHAVGLLGLSHSAISVAKSNNGATFWRAATAAEEAVRAHLAAGDPAPEPAPFVRSEPLSRRAATVRLLNAEKLAQPRPAAPAGVVTSALSAERETPGTLRAKIIEVLKDAPTTAPTLAILTDAKELTVCETLRVLVHEGKVQGGPIPPQGARFRNWRATERAA